MKGRLGFCLGLLVLLGWCRPLAAGLRPSFRVESSTWDATDILTATETGQGGGQAKVLEAWKGGAHPGEMIDLPGLAAFDPEAARTVKTWRLSGDESPPPPVHVTGSKMVLFLKRGTGAAPDWQPANLFGELSVAIVWIEGDKAYSYMQITNPGPSELRELPESPATLKSTVDGILQTQAALAEAARTADPAQRARALMPFASSEMFCTRREVFEELAKCGDAALPVLRVMLEDEKMRSRGGEVVEAMGRAGGAVVGPELIQILLRETEFWKQTAPSLPENWWNGNGSANWQETEAVRDRYGTTLSVIRALSEIGYRGDMSAVVQLRDYWDSLPQLGGKTGVEQMTTECNQLLQAADAGRR